MDWVLENDRPIFQQLYEQLARRIVSGSYPPGSRLPSVRELAAEAGVNPNTMQRALAQLEQADDAPAADVQLQVVQHNAGAVVFAQIRAGNQKFLHLRILLLLQ